MFTDEHVQMARAVRMAQSLGFSLREIVALERRIPGQTHDCRRVARKSCARQLARLEEKAAHVNAMTSYIHAKLAWMEAGGKGPEPNFTDYERRPGFVGLKAGCASDGPNRESEGKPKLIAVKQTVERQASGVLYNLYYGALPP